MATALEPKTSAAQSLGPAQRLQAATAAYQALQAELSNAVEARQRRETQLTENNMVKKVCELYTSYAALYLAKL